MRNGDWLVSLIEDWFYSDLDIQFALKRDPDEKTIADAIHGVKDEKALLCSFESDAWYDHTVRGSPRHEGNLRRFTVWEGDDDLYEEIEEYCNVLHDKSGIIDLIHVLDEDYTIFNAETFDELKPTKTWLALNRKLVRRIQKVAPLLEENNMDEHVWERCDICSRRTHPNEIALYKGICADCALCGECGQELTEKTMYSDYTCKKCAEKLNLDEG